MGAKAASTKKHTPHQMEYVQPLLKTVDSMSKISGIGENKLRELMDNGELEYVRIGNRRLIAEEAIWKWYNRSKVTNKVHGHSALAQKLPEL